MPHRNYEPADIPNAPTPVAYGESTVTNTAVVAIDAAGFGFTAEVCYI